ncbi:MAG: hypothetical protein JJE17_10610, partial [Peptostreptococcaceae bacterium]|nr:hypothetical protein [Peptostreptococcaceae bacterium]
MAAIHFESSIDNSKLNKGIKESEQTVEEFVKHVEKGGDSIGDFATQTSKQMRKSVDVQRNAIKELKQEIKELEAAMKSGGGSYEQNLQVHGKLADAKRNLASEEGALIDMQKAQVAGNVTEAESQTPVIAGLWKWALGLATVTAALKIGKAVIASTKDSADQFEFAVSAASEGLSYFWSTLASGDFSNFFSNMKEAIQLGWDYAEAMDKIKEARWAESMNEADQMLINTQNEIILKDPSQSPEKRLEAGEKRIADEKKFADIRIKNAEDELNATMLIAEGRSKIDKTTFDATNRESYAQNKLLNILKEVDETTRKKAEEYNKNGGFKMEGKTYQYIKTQEELIKSGNAKNIADEQAFLEKLKSNAAASPAVKLYAEALRGYGKLKEEMILNVVDAYKKVGEADDSSVKKLLSIFTVVGSARKKMKDDAIAASKKAKEDAELENRIKDTQEAIKALSGQELDNMAAKLVLLKSELFLRNEIAKSAIAVAENKPITSKGATTVSGAISDMQKATGLNFDPKAQIKYLEKISGLEGENAKRLKHRQKENAEYAKKTADDEEEAAKLKIETQKQIIQGARQLTGELIDQIGLSQEQNKQMQGMANALANAASGNLPAAAFNIASTLLSAITSSKNKDEDSTVRALENVNNLLEQQSVILSNLSDTNYFKLAEKQYKDLGIEIDLNTEKLRKSKITNSLGMSSYYSDYSASDFIDKFTSGILLLNDAQTESITAIIKARKQQSELLQDTFRQSLGFDSSEVSDSIFTGIWDGLKLGQNALGDFSSSFGDLMKKALMQSVTDAMNLSITNTFLPEYQKAIADNILTPE